MTRRKIHYRVVFLLFTLLGVSLGWVLEGFSPKVKYDLSELKRRLSPESYYVTQRSGTEPRYSEYYNSFEHGNYNCIVCSKPLFVSENKFKSKHNRPAFLKPHDNVAEVIHVGTIFKHHELKCNNCGSHIGECYHDDEEKVLRINKKNRYYVNSAAVKFEARGNTDQDTRTYFKRNHGYERRIFGSNGKIRYFFNTAAVKLDEGAVFELTTIE